MPAPTVIMNPEPPEVADTNGYVKDEKGRFLPGNIGGGRPKGSRNKLSENFFDVLHEDFQAHGSEAITKMR